MSSTHIRGRRIPCFFQYLLNYKTTFFGNGSSYWSNFYFFLKNGAAILTVQKKLEFVVGERRGVRFDSFPRKSNASLYVQYKLVPCKEQLTEKDRQPESIVEELRS